MTLPLAALLQGAVSGETGGGVTYVDDVFSTYIYNGNGSAQTITNGIDLAGKGGMVWLKSRDVAVNHAIADTERGRTHYLSSSLTNAQSTETSTYGITSFNANGFSLGLNNLGIGGTNTSGQNYASWTFRKAPKFFDVVTYTGTGSSQTISHSLNQTVGVLVIKRISGTGNWATFARTGGAAGATQYAYFNTSAGLNLTAAAGATGFGAEAAGFITSTGFKPNDLSGSGGAGNADNINENGSTYVAYLFAHDPSADGIIQAGSYTGNGSATGPDVTLGWEPQWVLIKAASADRGGWYLQDTMRGMVQQGSEGKVLFPNSSSAEGSPTNAITPTATGFKVGNVTNINAGADTYIYLAIRRPNKPPTSGTQVYNAIARTGTGAAATVTGVGFAPDVWWAEGRGTFDAIRYNADRLRGAPNVYLQTSSTSAEGTNPPAHTWGMDGVNLAGGNYSPNFGTGTTENYINHFFKRAPGVFETFCDTGTGANKTETHGLSVAPELWLRKGRSGTTEWVWGSSLLANTQKIVMPSPNGVVTDATAWNSTYPTATSFSIGTAAAVNTNAATYVTYLWATKAGVSKVFTYTGDGGSGKVINCGFTAGARFILIIRTTASTAQDIFIWDSARGIIAGNDPHLSLNTSAAEVTTDDSVDPDNSGFAINQVAATNINVNGAVYIGVAYA